MKAEYSQGPYMLLNHHEKGCEILGGRPIIMKHFDLGTIQETEDTIKLQVRVRGPKNAGTIHTESSKDPTSDKWKLNYAVMRVDSGKDSYNVWLFPDHGVESSKDNVSLKPIESISQ